MKQILATSLSNQRSLTGVDGTAPLRLLFKEVGVKDVPKTKRVSGFKWGTAGIRYDVPTKAYFVDRILRHKITAQHLSEKLSVTEQTVNNWVKQYSTRLAEALAAPIGTPYLAKVEKLVIGEVAELVNPTKSRDAVVASLAKQKKRPRKG